MQDPSTFQHQINHLPQFPDHQQEHLKCPRCDSDNTKFCYYNNYNLSQPRHLCKDCKRYWTKGGALRNIPVGGQSRKNITKKTSNHPKRHSVSNSSSSSVFTNSVSNSSSVFANSVSDSGPKPEHGLLYGAPIDHVNGSFSSLLASGGQFGNLLGGVGAMQMGEFSSSHGLNLDMELQNGWPDLTI